MNWYFEMLPRLEEVYGYMIGGTPIFKRDDELVPLQAADMLAWSVHRSLTHPAEARPILKKITAHHSNAEATRESLEKFVGWFGGRN